ncbi:MAG: hypothetical protein WBM62_07505 [Crocosphaera sp.]|jgi:hypothetical protein
MTNLVNARGEYHPIDTAWYTLPNASLVRTICKPNWLGAVGQDILVVLWEGT